MESGRLVFDGRCGFCTRSTGWLRRLDRRNRVEVRTLQTPGVPASVGRTAQECTEQVRWLGSDGRQRGGADAVNAALSAALGTRAPLHLYRLTAVAQDRVYAWVAANRYRLPGATPRCSTHPAECG
jgi:predicted DCC family thiol-disulfide oxidoreductase YuxK